VPVHDAVAVLAIATGARTGAENIVGVVPRAHAHEQLLLAQLTYKVRVRVRGRVRVRVRVRVRGSSLLSSPLPPPPTAGQSICQMVVDPSCGELACSSHLPSFGLNLP